ncbi:MAG: beta-ketoacyl-ACP synthase III [Prevotellaceae bacterium]|jgi:3-oxoacyl-[acyl-carrier-protein] synthase-3|nr:beta-ketoacyl-ACP synthase III [Prevotellaceae bacterium]
MRREVFINKVAKFLPNNPVNNDDIEKRLGLIGGKASRVKSIILRQNKIKTRYYAIDESGRFTHTNAQITANAVRELFKTGKYAMKDMQLLCCATASPDQMMPSHASMVHGELCDAPAMEIMSAAGVCCSSSIALKYGYISILSGNASNAICTGSELASPFLTAKNFEAEYEKMEELEKNPVIAFEKDFLRFMLSDGAGACLLSDVPNRNGISLKIECIETISFANELKACMYQGADKNEEGDLISWKMFEEKEWLDRSIFAIKQDVRYLDAHVVQKAVQHILNSLAKNNITPDEINFILPHISSMYFCEKLKKALIEAGSPFADEKWFINLPEVGNVGSASMYLMLEQLFNSGHLKPGQKLFVFNPESGRFSYSAALFTVV